jgi:hypothetical protein
LFIALLFGLAFLACGCVSPRGAYESGVAVVNQFEQPDSGDMEDAIEDLDYAISKAKKWLSQYESERTACRHDRTAYLIPMSRLAKARLYGRFNQITKQEDECWAAVRDAERYLGAHIRSLRFDRSGEALPFASYSVFFRREKIRRHAFTLLSETYRQAGEKDLVALMRAQVGFSDIYLRSPVSHSEEEYIRTIENSDWVRLYKLEKEDIAYGFQMFFFILAMAAAQAGAQMQRQELQSQMYMTQDPALRANLQQQIANLDMQIQQNMMMAMETLEQMEQSHLATVEAIELRFHNTVLGALVANFESLKLSDEVKALPQYGDLITKKDAFDNYVSRVGFDRQAAQALSDLRTSLDNLTLELQRRRKMGG